MTLIFQDDIIFNPRRDVKFDTMAVMAPIVMSTKVWQW